MNKYHAISTMGYASKKEANRATELKILQKCGEITNLREQVKYQLLPACRKADGKMERGVTWTADFVYNDKSGIEHVVDVKGMKTQQYIIRRKLMLFFHGITIEEL